MSKLSNTVCMFGNNEYGIAIPTTNCSATYCKGLRHVVFSQPLPFDVLNEDGLLVNTNANAITPINKQQFNSLNLTLQAKLKNVHNDYYNS